MKVTPVLLIILDGFGCSESQDNNAIASAHKPMRCRLLNVFSQLIPQAAGA